MKKVSIAICDVQDAYRERLAEYLIRKKGGQIQVFTFSDRKLFESAEEQEGFDIVLCGTGFEAVVPGEAGGLHIILSETPERREELGPAIFKYQSAEKILREIFEYFLELGRIDSGISGKEKEIIGIYSPTHSRLQTPFALTMAQMLSEEKKLLYVNLGEWAGFGQWFQEEYHRDLSDLLYLISGYGSQTQGILECVLHSVNRMDYIPPMTDAQLLCQATAEDYQTLLKLLVEKTDYEVICLDFGIMIPGFFSLLEQCTSIYGVIDQGVIARGQCRQFEESIMKSGMEQLAGKIEYISFSVDEAQKMEQEPVLHQWLYGELGDRARAVRYMKHGAY